MPRKEKTLLALVGPGILVAATGVGAGDLAIASFTGSMLGLTILWAVLLGAFLKFVLNEGLARWQLATGDTLLEGCVEHFGKPVQRIFMCYLILWSFLVGAMLMSAIGVVCLAIYAPFGSEAVNKVFYGVVHSAAAVVLVKAGGYRLFGKVMGVCIAAMFVVVVVAAVALRPPIGEFATGLVWPSIPAVKESVTWTVALMGGVGGTLTVLCYGYWIREEGRHGVEDLGTCRIDLATGYAMTAIFGVAMVVIGSRLGPLSGSGAGLVVAIAKDLETSLRETGPVVKWAFLIGAWGAVFSSLLGVWQSIPYLFADFWFLTKRGRKDGQSFSVDTKSRPYQAYLFGIALVPIIGLVAVDFKTLLKTYAVVGALFMPMLAFVLLVLNGRAKWVGTRYRNSFWTSLILVGTLLFFILVGMLQIQSKLFPTMRPEERHPTSTGAPLRPDSSAASTTAQIERPAAASRIVSPSLSMAWRKFSTNR